MKRIGIFLVAVLMGTLISSAQPGGRSMDPEEMAKRQTAQLKETLGLNADQEKQVYDLTLASRKKMMELREQNQGDWRSEGMREKMSQIRDEESKKMKGILTDAQWTKYQQYLEERRQRRGQGRP